MDFVSLVLVDDFSITNNHSLKLIFLTLRVVISLNLPAEKYSISASKEYFSGNPFDTSCSCSFVMTADLPLLLDFGITKSSLPDVLTILAGKECRYDGCCDSLE